VKGIYGSNDRGVTMDSKEKFTSKVSDYVKYRPKYPSEFVNYLLNEVGVSRSVVADIGAGTGILTKLLAAKVKTIYAVEPNFNMRSACEGYCDEFENFVAVDGSAENTSLSDKSVDFITVAQAFHWFDRHRTKIEFQRILKTKGKVILVWNSRMAENVLIRENDALCRDVCLEFNGFSGGSNANPESYSDFFKSGYCDYRVFENDRLLTLETYIGSSLSASYAPTESDDNYKEFINGLKDLFKKYSINDKLLLPHKTHSYVGEI